ncbi:hypothetical protein AB4305_19330 [Nocardia sp. 2YAB30]|uniref:hypothetical protein n=1 Tax=unclassified Nocardia TaxID=2637762 RepID=UPI003F949569
MRGHRPILAVEVDDEQIFFHCAEAFLRSHLGEPRRWPQDTLPNHACLVEEVQTNIAETVDELERYDAPENYQAELYRD